MYDPNALPGWADWLGLVLTVVGFGVAISQVVKTRDAADAAIQALERAESRLVSDQIMSMPAQFADVVSELSFAERESNADVARFALVRTHSLALEAAAVLKLARTDHTKVIRKLERTARQALQVKGELGEDVDVSQALKLMNIRVNEARAAISTIASTSRSALTHQHLEAR